jgi:hypothetical protein
MLLMDVTCYIQNSRKSVVGTQQTQHLVHHALFEMGLLARKREPQAQVTSHVQNESPEILRKRLFFALVRVKKSKLAMN